MDYGFELDPDEKVTKVVYRHIFDVLPTFVLAVILMLVAVALAYFAGFSPASLPFGLMVTAALVSLMLIIAVGMFLIGWYVYRHNFLVFTTEHLVQVEKIVLFQNRVSQLSFLRIEDVSGSRSGFLQTFFHYGNVQVQSAGEQEKFIFRNAPNPEDLADEILEIHEQCLRDAGITEGAPAHMAPLPPTPPAPTV
ncbi:MAG: hypothetical protein NVSMB39_1170 [Candidatus Saccharimonadales bacterium]